MKYLATLSMLVVLLAFNACKKKENLSYNFVVDNSWECTVGGIKYSGTIDTSLRLFYSNAFPNEFYAYCTGTSSDKKANIFFRLRLDRELWRGVTKETNNGNAVFLFDTSSATYLKALFNLGGIEFVIDDMTDDKIKGTFTGSAYIDGTAGISTTVTNGKFSFQFGKGNNEPKFYAYKVDNIPARGYISHARMVSNTLLLDGFGFDGDSTFQLQIRTGGIIKPGLYESVKGDVGYQTFIPSIVNGYVSDSIGNLKVNITAVNGNIIEGTFGGNCSCNASTSPGSITEGRFKCRVANYSPQPDSVNKWGFCIDSRGQYPFNTFGGNVLNASQQQTGSVTKLTINGESDFGKAKFKVVLSAFGSLTTGLYNNNISNKRIDSVYFLNSLGYYHFIPFSSEFYCQIDELSAQKVVGRMWGKAGFSYFVGASFSFNREMRKGYFKANF